MFENLQLLLRAFEQRQDIDEDAPQQVKKQQTVTSHTSLVYTERSNNVLWRSETFDALTHSEDLHPTRAKKENRSDWKKAAALPLAKTGKRDRTRRHSAAAEI